MTVKDLKKRLEHLDDNKMVLITDGEGWSNIDKLEDTESVGVFLHIEKHPVFSN